MGPRKKDRSASAEMAYSVIDRVHRAWGESPFYQARLRGPAPDRLLHQPVDPYTPDRALGEALAKGRFTVFAETIDCEGEIERAFSLAVRDGSAHRFLHGFEWLRHLAALGERGKAPATALLKRWLSENERWSPESWAPSLTGERLVSFVCHGAPVLQAGDALWRSRILTSLARQTRHLAECGHRTPAAFERLMTAAALCIAALCLPGCEGPAERGLELLRRELRVQIRPDGGHISRNPSRQLAIVIRLKMVIAALEARRLPAPGFLSHTVGRTASYVQIFRCGDGGLAAFNGGYEDDGKAVAAVNELVDLGAEPAGFARNSGFQRLESGRSVLIADVGVSQSGGAATAQVGAAAFQFNSGRARIFVNCGGGEHLDGQWEGALRQPAAHTTLSSEPAAAFQSLLKNAVHSHRRSEDALGQLLEIERKFGEGAGAPRHLRRLFLGTLGADLRGEDLFANFPPVLLTGWRLRFHLHPHARASVARDGRSVIIALANGEGWKFRSNFKQPRLEKSIYCALRGLPASSTQIVLGGGVDEQAPSSMVVRWALKRIDQ